MTLIEKNLEKITQLFDVNRYYPLRAQAQEISLVKELLTVYDIYSYAQQKRYIAQSLNIHAFIGFLADKSLLYSFSISINEKMYTRYKQNNQFDIYPFVYSFEKNGFFTMSTALKLQGLTDYKSSIIFYSHELTIKHNKKNTLQQEDIDKAFTKDYRYTKKIASYQDHRIVVLEPKHTNRIEVIDIDGFQVSSINRALVEMIINIQYFRSYENLLEIFMPIKDHLNIEKVFLVLKTMDLIYPYFNSVGFFLEQLGFSKQKLEIFKLEMSELKFYFEKKRDSYQYDEYWQTHF
jgi:hypothetical protein